MFVSTIVEPRIIRVLKSIGYTIFLLYMVLYLNH